MKNKYPLELSIELPVDDLLVGACLQAQLLRELRQPLRDVDHHGHRGFHRRRDLRGRRRCGLPSHDPRSRSGACRGQGLCLRLAIHR